MKYIKLHFVLLLSILISILIITYFGFVRRPILIGDGIEYYSMLESFYLHFSPEQRDTDITSLVSKARLLDESSFNFLKGTPHYFYVEASDNNYYPIHFWGYAIISLPAKSLLSFTGQDQMKAFQLTNSILLSVLIIYLSIQIKLKSNFRKVLFILFVLFSPATLYISWPHPELMCFVFVIMSLLLFLDKKIKLAIFFSALSTMQNPPVILLVGFFYILFIKRLIKKISIKELLMSIIALSPIIINYTYSLIVYKSLNPLIVLGYSKSENLSFFKTLELYFDPNLGVMIYEPFILFLSISFIIYVIYKLAKHKTITNQERFVIILGIITLMENFASTSTINWNSGALGSARYTTWSITPFLLITFFIFLNKINSNNQRWISCILFVSLLINIVVCSFTYIKDNNEFYFSPVGNFVLRYIPEIYNPSYEIFSQKALGSPELYKTEASIYLYNGHCTKALAFNNNEGQLSQIRAVCGKLGIVSFCDKGSCYYDF